MCRSSPGSRWSAWWLFLFGSAAGMTIKLVYVPKLSWVPVVCLVLTGFGFMASLFYIFRLWSAVNLEENAEQKQLPVEDVQADYDHRQQMWDLSYETTDLFCEQCERCAVL